jgi:hypothetical protein
MARLVTTGAEIEAGSAGSVDGSNTTTGSGAVTRDTGNARSGSASWKCAVVSGSVAAKSFSLGTTSTTVTYLCRCYFKLDALPTVDTNIAQIAGTSGVVARLTSTGALKLIVNAAQVGSTSADLVVADSSTWYRLEIAFRVGVGATDYAELLLDGISLASSSTLSITDGAPTPATYECGIRADPVATVNLWVDDVAINDSTGASQTSWPGDGKVVLLLPISDSAVGTGWTLGTGTAISANGYDSVNNTPPQGVTNVEAGSDPKQIRNAASAANSNYDANLTTYTTAGIAAADTINVLVPIVATAAPVSTSAKLGTIGISSNPAITNVDLGPGGTAKAFWSGTTEGTYPTGWKWSFGTTTYSPSVTLGNSPVARITQVTSSTRIATVCFLGMYVDYTPAVVASLVPPPFRQTATIYRM